MPDDLAWDLLDSGIDYTCPGFDVRRDEVRMPDGRESEFHYLQEGDSVVVIPLTPGGEVVVIEEWRQAVDRVNRGFPAGGIEDEDGDPADAAHRELAEETGYVADAVSRLATVEPANGITDAAFHFFVAEDCIENGAQDLDQDESIRVDRTTMDRLREAVREGRVRDGRTVTGVLYYDLLRPEES